MSAVSQVQDAWRVAAKELGFEFEAPFELHGQKGHASFHGFVRHVGGPKGAVFFACETFKEDHREARRLAEAEGVFCSLISARVYQAYDREVFLEVLQDWGWFGSESERPSWAGKTGGPTSDQRPTAVKCPPSNHSPRPAVAHS
jgi:hypothetical protein